MSYEQTYEPDEEVEDRLQRTRRSLDAQRRMTRPFSPPVSSLRPTQSSASFWILRTPREHRRWDVISRQSQSSLISDAAWLRLQRLLVRPLGILIVGACISAAWESCTVFENYHPASSDRKDFFKPKKALGGYPAIALAQATVAVDEAETSMTESSDDAPETTTLPLYGWEPTMYPDPIEDPSRCGISYLVDESNGDDFEFASGASHKHPNPLSMDTRLCDPDFVLGGSYLEQTAAALARFSEQFSQSATSAGIGTVAPPAWHLWQGRRTLSRPKSLSSVRFDVRFLEATSTNGKSDQSPPDVAGTQHGTRLASKSTSWKHNIDTTSDGLSHSKIQPSLQDHGTSTTYMRSDHVGVIVEAPSSDKEKNLRKKEPTARPPIELAVATVRKVRSLSWICVVL